MKQKSIMFLTLVLILSFATLASASFAKLSPNQLEHKAEVILVGYIEGAAGKYHFTDDLWDTEWMVRVMYYLKGNRLDNYLTVYSPGVKGASAGRSTDFSLNEKGNLVLLFLNKHDNRYFPITPQGIIGLQSKRYSREALDPLTGETVLKEYSIKDGTLTREEKAQMEEIIKQKTVTNPNKVTQKPPQKRFHFEDLFYFTSIGMSLLTTLAFAVIKFRRTNNIWRSFRQAVLINFLLLSIISLAWFHVTTDGFAQIFGLMGYGATFLINLTST